MTNSENGVLLTHDLNLCQQTMSRGLNADFVEATNEDEKLVDLPKRFVFNLTVDLSVFWCPKCNLMIRPVSSNVEIDESTE